MRLVSAALRIIPTGVRQAAVRAATQLRVSYLQRRVRYAQDEVEQMLDVQELLPVQLRMHEGQINRWLREIRALRGDQMRRDAIDPTTISGHAQQTPTARDGTHQRVRVRASSACMLPPSAASGAVSALGAMDRRA